MSDLQAELRRAFEEAGYDVDGVSDNRGRIRVALREVSPAGDDLRRITEDVCGEDAVLGFDVASEATGGEETVGTVVSFRHRA